MIALPHVNKRVPIPSNHPVANREDHVSTSSINTQMIYTHTILLQQAIK